MPQPALSAAIAALERTAQSLPFARCSRGMTPTAAGRQLRGRALAALAHLDAVAVHVGGRGSSGIRWPRLATALHLRSLCAPAGTRGLSSAARALNVAKPTVHRALRSFEALAGVRLWRRVGSAIDLSPDAAIFAHAASLCESEDRMGFEEVRELQGELDGGLRVGALPMPRSGWLPQSLAATPRDSPNTTGQIMDGPNENQLTALRNEQANVVLGALRFPAPGANVKHEPLFGDPLSIVVRADHPLGSLLGDGETDLTPGELRNLSWLLPHRSTPARQTFERFMTHNGAGAARRVVECNSLGAIRSLLLQSDYAALISSRQIDFECKLWRLRVLGRQFPEPLIRLASLRIVAFSRQRCCARF